MTARTIPARTAAAPLLYWLLVVCGLAGLTVQRIDTPAEILPLWLGTVVGVALGQLVAWFRIRAWVLAAVAMAGCWFAPVFLFVLYQSIRGPVETCVFAFLPAALCGYLSLSERGSLVAFWYPAVLWMLAILDGSAPGAFNARAALPLVIGLTALFVAYLRARETRRIAIWHSHASVRLATPKPRAVLRTSPLRAASQLAWTSFVGAAALVLAAWIAPHLWQKDHGKHTSAAAAQPVADPFASGATGQQAPCCPESGVSEEKRTRVREYFPLFHGQDEEERRPFTPCSVCRNGTPVTTASNGDTSDYGEFGGTLATSAGIDTSTPSTSDGTAAAWAPSPAHAVSPSVPPEATPDVVVPAAVPPPVVVRPRTPPPAVVPAPAAVPPSVAPVPPPASRPVASVKPGQPVAIVFVPKPAAPPPSTGTPWKSVLAFCLAGLALHVVVRALRRQLVLRHLRRPFWAETLDQRISNHWQRMLIGLRDAGIHPGINEQPEALARRVGIEGMDTCSTILERVRHGVRVDADDLEAMNSAAGTVYRHARVKAGISGRAAAWLRWPLA